MRSLKALLVFGFLSTLIAPVILLEATPEAYAQQCPNGVCP
jgi:hypothetical protein